VPRLRQRRDAPGSCANQRTYISRIHRRLYSPLLYPRLSSEFRIEQEENRVSRDWRTSATGSASRRFTPSPGGSDNCRRRSLKQILRGFDFPIPNSEHSIFATGRDPPAVSGHRQCIRHVRQAREPPYPFTVFVDHPRFFGITRGNPKVTFQKDYTGHFALQTSGLFAFFAGDTVPALLEGLAPGSPHRKQIITNKSLFFRLRERWRRPLLKGSSATSWGISAFIPEKATLGSCAVHSGQTAG